MVDNDHHPGEPTEDGMELLCPRCVEDLEEYEELDFNDEERP
jgi:hypothetical protein